MNFLNLCNTTWCHGPEAIVYQHPALKCNVCQASPIPDVYEYIKNPPGDDNFLSAALARAFYEWTGDDQVPMTFPLVQIKGIMDTRVVGQSLKLVCESIKLLKSLNEPFVKGTFPNIDDTMKNFVNNYQSAIKWCVDNQMVDVPANQQLIFRHLLLNAHSILNCGNLFQMYFEKLVPSVKACRGHELLQDCPDDENGNVALRLHYQLKVSDMIRQIYGPYCWMFDIIHALVGIYVSSSDVNVVLNWTLDVLARLCRGDYFWENFPQPCKYVTAIQQIVDKNVSYRKRTELYYVVKAIRNGTITESLSEMLPQYERLETLIREKLDVETDLVINNLFPSVLFQNSSDQLGFQMAFSHVLINLDLQNGNLNKGTYARARKIGCVVTNFSKSLKEFEKIPLCWTVDTFKMFLAHDETLETDLVKGVKLLLTSDDE